MKKKIYVLTGGTFSPVAPHFSLSAPAFGLVGNEIDHLLKMHEASKEYEIIFVPTLMAIGALAMTNTKDMEQAELKSQDILEQRYTTYQRLLKRVGIRNLGTNDDVAKLLAYLVKDQATRAIIMPVAMSDFAVIDINKIYGDTIYDNGNRKARPKRLDSSKEYLLHIKSQKKLIGTIRQKRKDIFVVGFKTTDQLSKEDAYAKGLALLKKSSCNLVFVNDVTNREQLIVTPEEYPYYFGEDRPGALQSLVNMTYARLNHRFVRTELIDESFADIRELDDQQKIPHNFVEVLEWLLSKNAYKPFKGRTSGHFGCKVSGALYTRIASVRKVNHNNVFEDGVAKIYGLNDGKIIAGGRLKPSVGEHTQDAIYTMLGDAVHSIVHFHCPLRQGVSAIPMQSQQGFECGSVECAQNTVSGLSDMEPLGFPGIYAVHLDHHGPNIAFHRDVTPELMRSFIDTYWDLSQKEGGIVN